MSLENLQPENSGSKELFSKRIFRPRSAWTKEKLAHALGMDMRDVRRIEEHKTGLSHVSQDGEDTIFSVDQYLSEQKEGK